MRKNWLCLLLAALMLLAGLAAAESAPGYAIIYSSSNPIPEIAARVRPSVVEVLAKVESWDASTRISSVDTVSGGSGCYIRAAEEGGYILTNNHVVEDGDVLSIHWLDGTEMDCELVGTDVGTDIAVLKFSEPAPEGAEPIPMGDSDALVIGELAIAIGNPGSGDETLYGTVTAGIISGLERAANADNFERSISVIQTDAAINVGNSGGALLNAKGELVGIPTLKYMYTYDVIYEGLGFCIPINKVSGYVDQLIENGVVVRPRMGITVAALDGPDEPMHNYRPAGMEVYEVEEGTSAYEQGMQAGDVITEVNGVRVYDFFDLTGVIDQLEAGDELELKCYRYEKNGEEYTGRYEELYFTVTLSLLD